MPLTDDVSAQQDQDFSGVDHTNDAAYGLNAHALTSDQGSIWDSLGNVITKAVPLTGLSIVNSFANTAIKVGNWFGADNQYLSIEDEVGDGDLNDYYNLHSQGIEAAGLAIGSLIPGMAAVKALKLLQAGKATNALVRATNIFNGFKEKTIQGAIEEINAGDGALFGNYTAQKFKAVAAGLGDNALQTMAYQIATLGTMKASPLLDQQSYGDTITDFFYGTLVGGAVGGALDSIGTLALFNKAVLKADVGTKTAENASYFGKGNYIAGDRVVALLNSIDNIPAQTTVLGSTKAAATRDAAILNAKKILIGEPGKPGIIDSGDNILVTKMMDSILQMRDTGGLSKEDMYMHLAGLQKATRMNDSAVTQDGSTFFVNQFTKQELKSGNIDWPDIVTPTPRYSFAGDVKPVTDVGVSRAYKLVDGATNYSAATSKDFDKVSDAWAVGHDLFIDGRGQVHINPDSTNLERVARPGEWRVLSAKEEKSYRATGQLPKGSKPLLGAPTVFDTITGDISETAAPVIGDFKDVRANDAGVSYGDNFSQQAIDKPLTADMSNLDANARYVWAAERGVRVGDTIKDGDLPMMEQFYREGIASKLSWAEYTARAEKRGISFENGVMPVSAQDALGGIKDAKDDFIGQLLEDKSLSSQDIARRANVTEDYLASGLRTDKTSDYMVPAEQSSELRHVRLWYNVGNTTMGLDGQIQRGLQDTQYRIQVIADATKMAATKFFTAVGTDANQFIINRTSADANIRGVGSSFLGFSKAAYDTLGQETERVGRMVSSLFQKRVAGVASRLASAASALRNDQDAAAELGMFRNVRLRTNKDYVFLPDALAQAAGFGDTKIAVLKDLVKYDKLGNPIDWDRNIVPDGFVDGRHVDLAKDFGTTGNFTYYGLSPKVADWEQANLELNNARITHRNSFYSATGLNRQLPSDILYTPPINTANYKHFAYVKMREGMGGADSDASVVTAETAKDLEAKIASLQSSGQFSVFTKDQLKDYHQVVGDYEYSRNFANTQVNSALQRNGILNDVFPVTRSENLIKDYTDWHQRQEMLLIRDHVELGNGQLFAELKQMGSRFVSAETSQTGWVPTSLGKSAENPYDSYTKSALSISSKENYRLWSNANEVTEAFFDNAFRTAKQAFWSAQKGVISFDQANTMAENMGLGNIYGNSVKALQSTYYNVVNKLPPERYLSKFLAAGNSILGATVIKLDTFQQLIHILSTPILTLAEANSAKQYLTTTLPDGRGTQVPAISKIFFKALGNYFNDDIRAKWLPAYKDLNLIHDPDTINQHFQLTEALSAPWGNWSENGLTDKINSATKIAQKFLGTNFSEAFTSWMGAETGRLIFEAAGYQGKQLTDNIASFANRVKGNLVASQRPVAFQGPLGQAVGLFQTYQFNMMQQMFKYVENGEGKTLAILAGLQTSLFGYSSLPGFQVLNNHIIGNAAENPYHKDLYSSTNNLVDKTVGDWLLYGATSNWPKMLGASDGWGLFSRGDMNPRNISLLPVNPMEYPAVSGAVRFLSMVSGISTKIANGGDIPSSILLGLEHNGLSRPLQGMAQLAQGFATTSKGSLISTVNQPLGNNTLGWNDLASAANFGRLLGARPLDEAAVLDADYRNTMYQARTNARIEKLGEGVKSTLLGGNPPSPDQVQDFAARFAQSGGKIQDFGKKMVEWTTDTKASIANKTFRALQTPQTQQMMMIMGGRPLADNYTPQTSRSTAPMSAPGMRKGFDGKNYVDDPNRPGKYLQVQE